MFMVFPFPPSDHFPLGSAHPSAMGLRRWCPCLFYGSFEWKWIILQYCTAASLSTQSVVA